MQVVITGHRLQSFGFHNYAVHRRLHSALYNKIAKLAPEILITGMALGVDQWAAASCIKLNIPFIACLPFKGQELKWSPKYQQHYYSLLKKAAKVVEVDRETGYISEKVPPGVYHREKMITRNRYIVDQMEPGDKLLAMYIASNNNSGSAACVGYAANKLDALPSSFTIHIKPEEICPELDDVLPF